jgi:hypothetical protein
MKRVIQGTVIMRKKIEGMVTMMRTIEGEAIMKKTVEVVGTMTVRIGVKGTITMMIGIIRIRLTEATKKDLAVAGTDLEGKRKVNQRDLALVEKESVPSLSQVPWNRSNSGRVESSKPDR